MTAVIKEVALDANGMPGRGFQDVLRCPAGGPEMRTHFRRRAATLVLKVGIRHQNNVYIVRFIARDVAVDGLAHIDIRVMSIFHKGDVGDVFALPQTLHNLTVRNVSRYVLTL